MSEMPETSPVLMRQDAVTEVPDDVAELIGKLELFASEQTENIPREAEEAAEEEYEENYDYYDDEYDDHEELQHEHDDFIPCCMCGRDCTGSDYERERLCSRSCMVEEVSGM